MGKTQKEVQEHYGIVEPVLKRMVKEWDETINHIDNLSREEKAILLSTVMNMGWDYDRFSSSGRSFFDKICELLNLED